MTCVGKIIMTHLMEIAINLRSIQKVSCCLRRGVDAGTLGKVCCCHAGFFFFSIVNISIFFLSRFHDDINTSELTRRHWKTALLSFRAGGYLD